MPLAINPKFISSDMTDDAELAAASTADRDRANHTGTQAASTITGLSAVATSGLKADVGLSDVDNTSDASKAASGPVRTAIDETSIINALIFG